MSVGLPPARLRVARSAGAGFLSFEDARRFMHEEHLKSTADWRRWCLEGRRPQNIPSHPDRVYRRDGSWKGIPDWLGYKMRPTPKEMRSPLLKMGRAKELFLSKVPSSFTFESLPHKSAASLIFKTPGASLWCPVVLRSKQHLPRGYVSFITAPRADPGMGTFVVDRLTEKIYYFPRNYVQPRLRVVRKSRSGLQQYHKIGLPRGETIEEYEVRDEVAFQRVLEDHYNTTILLAEDELSAFYFRSCDAVWYCVAQQAVAFLRKSCRITVLRPVETFLNAHFIINGNPVWFRCLVLRHRYDHHGVDGERAPLYVLQLRFWQSGGESSESLGDCLRNGRPTFICALLRADDGALQAFSDERLTGLYIFPTEFLLRSGCLPTEERRRNMGEESFYVYPPGRNMERCNARSRRRHIEQQEFYIDLSPAADIQASARKAREIFAKFGTIGSAGKSASTTSGNAEISTC